MRPYFILFFTLLRVKSYSQYEPGFLPEFFFGRQPNARAEAMGKGYNSLDGDLGSIYFNPAGTATIKGIELNTSYTKPGYYATKGYYTFFALNYKAHKYLQVALSQFHFNYDKTPFINSNTTPYVKNITLTTSSEPIKNLLVGINTNYFIWEPGIDKTSKAVFLDFGTNKKFPIASKKLHNQIISFGVSIGNFNSASTTASFNNITETFHLPVIARYGISYTSSLGKLHSLDSASIVRTTFQIEYQDLLNSSYRSGIRFGGEVTIVNILSLRAGWYNEKVYDYGFPNNNKSKIESFTYGAGINIPLHALLKFPVDIQFDFTSLPQASSSYTYTNWENFRTFGLRMVYKPARKAS